MYSIIQNGNTGVIGQMIGFAHGASTIAGAFIDVYDKVRLTDDGNAEAFQTTYILVAFSSITAAVPSIDDFCIVRVLKVL